MPVQGEWGRRMCFCFGSCLSNGVMIVRVRGPLLLIVAIKTVWKVNSELREKRSDEWVSSVSAVVYSAWDGVYKALGIAHLAVWCKCIACSALSGGEPGHFGNETKELIPVL